MHRVYCIIGRTASGKSTLSKLAANKLNKKILRSYTTRDLRKNETVELSDHIHIKPEQVDEYRDDMIAYTDRVGYCSFATKSQLMDCDIYIINPSDYYELEEKTKDMDVKLETIYITVPYQMCEKRAKARKSYNEWIENYKAENDEFKEFESSGKIHYRVLNDTTVEEAVNKLIRIIKKVEVND